MQKQLEFKKFSKQLGFLSLLVGKIVPVVYAKIAKDLNYINYLIVEKDISKLMSFHPVLVDHLKHYNILMSSGLMLSESSSAIDFNRKLIFKWIPDTVVGKKSKEKHMNVIISNLDILQLTLPQIDDSLSFFVTLYDSGKTMEKKGDKTGKGDTMVEITSLGDAYTIISKQIKVITSMIDALKKFKIGGDDDGDGEVDEVDDEENLAIENQNNYDLEENSPPPPQFAPISTVKIGGYSGSEREFVGNYITNDRYLAVVSAFKYLNRLIAGGSDFGPIHKSLWGDGGVFPMFHKSVSSKPIDSYHELRALCQTSSDDYAKMLVQFLKLDHLVTTQKKSIMEQKIPSDMTDYLHRHAKKYLDLNLNLNWDLDFHNDPVTYMSSFLEKLDDLDTKVIARYATSQPPPGHRTQVKNKIKSDLELLSSWQPVRVPFIKCVGTFIPDDEFLNMTPEVQAKKVIEMAQEMLNIEQNHRDIASLEESYTKQANLLGQLYNSEELKHLIQAGYVETCIMKEIGDLKKE